ncbi:Kinesin-like protein NACK1, partial [Mucuna pruriens]
MARSSESRLLVVVMLRALMVPCFEEAWSCSDLVEGCHNFHRQSTAAEEGATSGSIEARLAIFEFEMLKQNFSFSAKNGQQVAYMKRIVIKKRPISKENAQQVADMKADDETKHRKIENIVANGEVSGDQLLKASMEETNGNLKNGGEKYFVQRSKKKQQNGSVEADVLNIQNMTVKTLGTPASMIDRTHVSTLGGARAKEEKIVVTIRLRPLNGREQLAKDQVALECINDYNIVYKPPTHDRASQPASFTFDKVFGHVSLTEAVYEEGVKKVALSALTGINATVFAYGQSSSGKTYTMRGIIEKVVSDIYQHIVNNLERDFTIKIYGLEIYNENVRDLLNLESSRSLKLLDAPKKGTMVKKLMEEIAKDDKHLRHLISICEDY